MRRSLIAVLAFLLAAAGLVATPGAASAGEYPVNYNFVDNAIRYGALDSPPGANDWTCRPSVRHPLPVVLVHGTGGSAGGNWGTLSAVLANEGYCVFALTYGLAPELAALPVKVGGLTDMRLSAQQLADFVDRVLAATGAPEVDLVGHSQGSLMPGWYLKFLDGAAHVRSHVSLASAWQGFGGTGSARFLGLPGLLGLDLVQLVPVADSVTQFPRGSAFMTALHEGGIAVEGVDYTNIVTRYDQVVLPYTIGIAPGMRNIVLQDHCALDFSDHVQIPSSPNAIRLVLNALDPARAQPVRCRLVLPVNGFVSPPLS